MSDEEVDAEKSENVLGAIARGTTDGLHLAINIAAMLISFLALIALIDGILGWAPTTALRTSVFGWFPASLETIFGCSSRPSRG